MKKVILIALLILLATPVFAATRRIYVNFDDQTLGGLTARKYGGTATPPEYNLNAVGRGGTGYSFSSGTVLDAFLEWATPTNPWPTDEMYVSMWMRYPTFLSDLEEPDAENIKFFYPYWDGGDSYVHYAMFNTGAVYYSAACQGVMCSISNYLSCLNQCDGNWHHYEIYVKFSTGISRFWYDGVLKVDHAYGTGHWTNTVLNVNAPSIDGNHQNTTFSRQVDDWEVWDGMPTAGATYYVTQSGAGSANGLTLGNAASIATFNAGTSPFNDLAGDTVYFDGTFTTGLNTPCGGSVGNLAILDLSTATWSATAQQQLDIDQPYVRVQNALLINVADTGSVPTGIIVREDHVEIDSCIIVGKGATATKAYSSGIYVSTTAATGFLITRNNISHACLGVWLKTQGIAGIIGGSAGMGNTIHHNDARVTDGADGIDVGTDRVVPQMEDYTGLVISYNTIYECPDDGIDLYYGSNVVVEHNEVGPQTTAGGDSNGIKCGSDNNATYNIVRCNYVHDYTAWAQTVGYDGGIVTNSADHTIILSNYIYNCFRGITISWNSHGHLIANNTISAAQDRGVSFGDEVLSSTFQNNICDGANYDLLVNATSENIVGGYNCFKHDTSHPAGDYTNTGTSDLFATNPLLASTYVLSANSPCINVGTTLADVTTDIRSVSRPQGSAYDIGAYEFIGATMQGCSLSGGAIH